MNDKIQKILDDIYTIEPDLKKQEPDIIKIIDALLSAKPDVTWDTNFQNNLKNKILENFQNNNLNKKSLKINFKNMNKLAYGLGGVALLLVLVILPQTLKKGQGPNTNLNNNVPGLNLGLEIAKVGANAFGTLQAASSGDNGAMTASAPQANGVATEEADSTKAAPGRVAAGYGGGGGVSGAGMDATSSIAPYPYYYTNYNYIYAGEEFTQDQSQLDVLKRIKNIDSTISGIDNVDLGIFDLGKLKNGKVQIFTINEDREFGYSVSVDLQEGMISIYENYLKWPQPNYDKQLTMSDWPADEEMINIANDFMQEYGIDTSIYGTPEVDKNWLMAYPADAAGIIRPDYVPYYASLIYPLMIDGKTVYDESGNKFGMTVSINLYHKKVSSVWNIFAQKYQSSGYQMETDVAKILERAQRGGFYPMPLYESDDQAQIQNIDISLGTPELAWVSTWQYENNQSHQLFVPALVFPITDKPDDLGYYWQKNIVVPLATDLLNQNNDYPPIRIMEDTNVDPKNSGYAQ